MFDVAIIAKRIHHILMSDVLDNARPELGLAYAAYLAMAQIYEEMLGFPTSLTETSEMQE